MISSAPSSIRIAQTIWMCRLSSARKQTEKQWAVSSGQLAEKARRQ
jgi:hypothetical protein